MRNRKRYLEFKAEVERFVEVLASTTDTSVTLEERESTYPPRKDQIEFLIKAEFYLGVRGNRSFYIISREIQDIEYGFYYVESVFEGLAMAITRYRFDHYKGIRRKEND